MTPIVDAGFAALCPPLTAEERTGLRDSLLAEGCRDALVVWGETGILLDGHNRLAICEAEGIEYRTVERSFADRESAEDWVLRNQLGRRNLSPGAASLLRGRLYNRQKAPAYGREGRTFGVEDSAAPKTAERLAGELGVSERTIRNDGAFARAVEDLEPYVPDIAERVMAGDVPSRQAVIEAAKEPETAPAKLNNVHFSSDTDEWYTPPHIIESVQRVFAIDLDPCSNSKATPAVPAHYHLTREDNGLEHPWLGAVYMNPPYGRELADWVRKLVTEFENGHTTEAIALVPSRTDTQWFRQLAQFPRCFLWGRLQFSGHDNAAPFPSMVVYLGQRLDRFRQAFAGIGDIYQQVTD